MEVARYDYAAQFGDDLESVIARHSCCADRGAPRRGRRGGRVRARVCGVRRRGSRAGGQHRNRRAGRRTSRARDRARRRGHHTGQHFQRHGRSDPPHGRHAGLSSTPTMRFLIDDRRWRRRSRQDAGSPARPSLRPGHAHGGILRLADRHSLRRRRRRGPGARQRRSAADASDRRAARLLQLPPEQEPRGAGDGGMVVTSDQRARGEDRRLRSLGQRGQNDHVMVGLNTHLHALQAIVLQAKLRSSTNGIRRQMSLAHTGRVSIVPPAVVPGIRRGRESARLPSLPGALVAYGTSYCDTSSKPESMRSCGIQYRSTSSRPSPSQGWRRGQFPIAGAVGQSTPLPFRSARTCDKRERSITSSTRRSSSFSRRDHAPS